MSNTFTNRLKKRLPAPGDPNWDDEWHDNGNIDDVAVGALMSINRVISGGEVTDGGGLSVDYAAIVGRLDGVQMNIDTGNLAMSAAEAGTDAAGNVLTVANWVYVNGSGVVVTSLTPPSGDYIPLAIVDTDNASILRIADLRPMSEDVYFAPPTLADVGRVLTVMPDKSLAYQQFLSLYPTFYQRTDLFAIVAAGTDAGRRSILTPTDLGLVVNSVLLTISQLTIDLSLSANWDSITPTDYTVAASRAGNDFYIYAIDDGLLISANSTVPAGYTSDNSRKVGGFHCLCADVGTISGHPLTGFLAGDILPASIWDLSHRPVCSPSGMVYSSGSGLWVDIYLQSGTGTNTASVYGGTITDTRDWMDFVDDLRAVSKRLLTDPEFQDIAAGSNEETNITGSADPVTTGGHIDTAGRRMISAIGCEDCCGALWQWLQDQSYQYSTGAFAWYDLPGAKGSLYMQGTLGDVKLLAGGSWASGSYCGSRSRNAYNSRWYANSGLGSRGCARRQGA